MPVTSPPPPRRSTAPTSRRSRARSRPTATWTCTGCAWPTFSASTFGTVDTLADTKLFLFDAAGAGVYANDDVAGGTTVRSTLPAGHALTPQAAGVYYLAVGASGIDPLDAGANSIFDGNEIAGPVDGDAVASWAGSTSTGSYTVNITGTVPCPGGECTGVITGATVPGNLTVPIGGLCNMTDSTVGGNITVRPGGRLILIRTTVKGAVSVQGGVLQTTRSSVRGNVVSLNPTDIEMAVAVRLCDTQFGGSVTVRGATLPARIRIAGSPGGGVCLGNTIRGTLTSQNNRTAASIGPLVHNIEDTGSVATWSARARVPPRSAGTTR